MKALRLWIYTSVFTLILFSAITFGVLLRPSGVFHTNYMSVICDKFDRLMSIDEPKIIILGGSNCAFGIDQDMIEEETGYKVVNMGLHAGFGHAFYTELAKRNINKGDIVLLAYEYNWVEPTAFTEIGADLVMSGIDDNIYMYRYVSKEQIPSLIGYLPTYASEKRQAQEADGIYSREAFDPVSTQLSMEIEGIYEYDPVINGPFTLNTNISENSVNYLKGLKSFVEGKGAKIYFVATPVARESVENDYREFDELKSLEENLIGIEYLSDPKDYLFDGTLMYDTKYHCNTKGMKKRTELLIEDLKKVDL